MRVIAGEAHGRRLRAPRGLVTRPATARVRASIFSRLAARTDLNGARVLDLFAGSGSLGLEALSRGAARRGLRRFLARGGNGDSRQPARAWP